MDLSAIHGLSQEELDAELKSLPKPAKNTEIEKLRQANKSSCTCCGAELVGEPKSCVCGAGAQALTRHN